MLPVVIIKELKSNMKKVGEIWKYWDRRYFFKIIFYCTI